jgi:hypothetical protein
MPASIGKACQSQILPDYLECSQNLNFANSDTIRWVPLCGKYRLFLLKIHSRLAMFRHCAAKNILAAPRINKNTADLHGGGWSIARYAELPSVASVAGHGLRCPA